MERVNIQISSQCPAGKNWTNVDGEYKSITVSGKGHVWAVDMTDRIWWRKGAKTQSATGSGWKCIAGNLSNVVAGPCGVWGLDAKNQVMFRDGTVDDPDDSEGSGWTMVDGKFIGLAVGDGVVLGLGANREIFYRWVFLSLTGNKLSNGDLRLKTHSKFILNVLRHF